MKRIIDKEITRYSDNSGHITYKKAFTSLKEVLVFYKHFSKERNSIIYIENNNTIWLKDRYAGHCMDEDDDYDFDITEEEKIIKKWKQIHWKIIPFWLNSTKYKQDIHCEIDSNFDLTLELRKITDECMINNEFEKDFLSLYPEVIIKTTLIEKHVK